MTPYFKKKEKKKVGRKPKGYLEKTKGLYVGLTGQEIDDLLLINDDLLDASYDTEHKRATRIVKKYILNSKEEDGK